MIEELQRSIERLEEKNEDLQDDIRGLKYELEEKDSVIEDLKEEVQDLKEELEEEKREYDMDDALICAYFMGAEDYKDKIKELQLQNRNLKEALAEIWWMARRYANGRSTYAPHQFNLVTQSLRASGLLTDTDNGEMWASDGDFGKWNPDTKQFEGEK